MADATTTTVLCPSCSTRLKVKSEALGRKLRCPKCEAPFVAATPQATPSEAVRRTASASSGSTIRQKRSAAPPEDNGDDDEAPAESRPRKKKRKKRRAEPTNMLPIILGLGFVLLLGGGVIVAVLVAKNMSGRGGSSAASVDELEEFTLAGGFKIKFPADWPADFGGQNNAKWVSFEKGSSRIKAGESLAASLMTDIAGGGLELDKTEFSPQARVHAQLQGKTIDDYDFGESYKEDEPEQFTAPFGQGRRSEFSVKQTFQTVKGYRTTVVSGTKVVIIVCQCNSKDWDSLAPVFRECMESLGFPGRD